MPARRRASAGRTALVLVPLAFLAVFFLYPFVTILGRGLWPDGALDLSPLGDTLGDASVRDIAWFTLWQAALSTALTIAVALPGAYVLARYRFPGRSLVRAVVTVPFVLPTVVVATAFLALGVRQSLGAILLAHVFFNLAVVVRGVGALWSTLDPHEEDAARVLGASRWRTFTAVTLPALRPALLATGAIVFLFDFTSFGVVLLLGGPTRATLETEIYRQTADLLDLRTAAALALLQLVAVLVLLVIVGRFQRRASVARTLRPERETARPPRGLRERALVGGTVAGMLLFVGVPIGVLVARSFGIGGGSAVGLGSYRALDELHAGSVLFVAPAEAIRNSVLFALVATALAVGVGTCAAFAIARTRRGSALDAALALPLGVSAVTIGFGFLIALDEPPLDLRTSWILVPIAQALVAIPFVIRFVLPTLQAVDPHLRESAALLGAPPRRVWREVDLPLAARGILVASGFAFAISLGEFGATVFIARPDRPTLPVVIFRLLGQPGSVGFGAAMAASTILLALTALAVLLTEWISARLGDRTDAALVF